jgi:beta-lactamase class A
MHPSPVTRSIAITLALAACARPTAEAPPDPLVRDLTAMLDSLNARTALYAKHLPTGRTIEVRADQPMNPLSVIKVPIMIQAFRDAEAGRLRLSDRHTVRPEELRRGSGLIQTFDVGLNPTYRDLVEQMIITSDNTATDILIEKVGLRVNATLTELGYRDTRLNMTVGDLFREVWVRFDSANATLTHRQVFERGFPRGPTMAEVSFALEGDSTRWLGRTTARELGRMLEELLAGRFATPEHTTQMVDILKRQFYSSRIPRRLQWRSPVEIAHKTGDWPPYAGNDVGILFYEGGPTVLAVFTNQNRSDFFDLESTIGRIAERLVNEWK